MLKTLLPILAAGVAIYQWDKSRRQRNQRAANTAATQPHDETLWEGEGGALPETGAQLGPEPRAAA